LLVLAEFVILSIISYYSFTTAITPPDNYVPTKTISLNETAPISSSFFRFLVDIFSFGDVFAAINLRKDEQHLELFGGGVKPKNGYFSKVDSLERGKDPSEEDFDGGSSKIVNRKPFSKYLSNNSDQSGGPSSPLLSN
jgi:hypothetical protein